MTETRAPLANIEAEQALLGALLVNNESLSTIRVPLEPAHFAEPIHARIFETIRAMTALGRIASPVTMFNYFQNDETLKELGVGAGYLARLAASAVTVINAPDYALSVFDLYLRRQAIERASAAVEDLYSLPVDVTAPDYISGLAQGFSDLAEDFGAMGKTTFTAEAAVTAAIDSAASAYQNDGKIPDAVQTGLADLDDKIGGLVPGDLVIVGARPSMGKTAVGLQLAMNAAMRGEPSMFVSLEMSKTQLGHRMLSMMLRPRMSLPFSRIARGRFDEKEFDPITVAGEAIKKLPLIIEDRGNLNLAGFRSVVARAKTRHPKLKVVVLDYMGLMDAGDRYKGQKVNELTEISNGLKKTAKQLGVCVVALHQLSRALENREQKRPTLADLRDSGAIEQDADIVIFPFREAYYLMREYETYDPNTPAALEISDKLREMGRRMELIIAKNRQGATATVKAWCDIECNYIADEAPMMVTQGAMELMP